MIPNRKLQESIINYLKTYGPHSRKEIAQSLGVSQAIITQVTRFMISKNLIHEKGEGKPGRRGGRRPIYLDINSEKGYAMDFPIEKPLGPSKDIQKFRFFK